MGEGHIGHRLDFRHLQHSEVGLPLVESIQGIVVGAEIVGRCLPSNRSLEHPAQSRSIHDAALNTKTNNATRELIHHHENPMCSQRCGFASEQIAAPKTVLHVTEKCEPGRDLPHPIPAGNERPGYGEISLSISTPKAKVICWAIRGQPQLGLRRFILTTASTSSLLGPFGPGCRPRLVENNI